MARYDRDSDYKISKFEFVNEINATPNDEDNEPGPTDEDENNDYHKNQTHNERVIDNPTNTNADKFRNEMEEVSERAETE